MNPIYMSALSIDSQSRPVCIKLGIKWYEISYTQWTSLLNGEGNTVRLSGLNKTNKSENQRQ